MRLIASSGTRAVLVAILVLLASGCLDEGTNPEFTPSSLWEGMLAPADFGPDADLPEVSGPVAVVVQGTVSRVGMGLEGVDRELYWGLFEQTCADPGSAILPIGLFPTLPAGASDVQYRIAEPLVPGGSYHVRIAADGAMEETVACADLEETSAPTSQ